MSPGKKETIVSVVWIGILLGATLLFNLRWSPVYRSLDADSGVYAYVGSSILEGQLPYRDVWEHKPPVGLYLNALALVMFGHTPWAIWWFNVIWIALTSVIFFLLVRKMMGTLTGCLASLFFLAGVMLPELFQGGNLMEVYGLLPQVLLIAAVYQFFSKQKERWIFVAGLLTGLAFLTKQTTIALGLSSILAILVISFLERKFKQGFIRLFTFGIGMLLPVILATFYWLAFGALNDYLDAVFLHSLAYVGARTSFLRSLAITLIKILPPMLISQLFFAGCIASLIYILDNRKSIQSYWRYGMADISPVELTYAGIFIAFPLELVFASLGGRYFGHYFLTLVPATALVSAYILWKAIFVLRIAFTEKRLVSVLGAAWLLLGTLSLFWLGEAILKGKSGIEELNSITRIFYKEYPLNDLETYIVDTTQQEDRVLVWHVHTKINFITERKAAARVLFPMNLFIGNSKMPEFVSHMTSDPPELIIFQKSSSIGLPFVDENIDEWCESSCMPEIESGLEQPVVYKALIDFQEFFLQNYIFDRQIYDWFIYRYVIK